MLPRSWPRPPYYWTPPPAMVLEHFAQIGAAVSIPFLVYNAPEEMAGTKMTAELALKLMDRPPISRAWWTRASTGNSWSELVDRARRPRPAFQLLSGAEYMVSAGRHRREGGILAARRDRARAGARALRSLPQGPAVRGAQGPGGDRGAAAACEESRRQRASRRRCARWGAIAARSARRCGPWARSSPARSRNGWAPWPRCAPSRVDGEIQR